MSRGFAGPSQGEGRKEESANVGRNHGTPVLKQNQPKEAGPHCASHTHRHATRTYKETHTQTQRDTRTHTLTCTHRHTNIHRHTCTHRHTHEEQEVADHSSYPDSCLYFVPRHGRASTTALAAQQLWAECLQAKECQARRTTARVCLAGSQAPDLPGRGSRGGCISQGSP